MNAELRLKELKLYLKFELRNSLRQLEFEESEPVVNRDLLIRIGTEVRIYRKLLQEINFE
jgi:hypothetical protein